MEKKNGYPRWSPKLFSPSPNGNIVLVEIITPLSGLHAQYLTLNPSWSIEPRFSIKWQFKQNQSLAFGTGLHSQMLPVYQYFLQDDNGQLYTNRKVRLYTKFSCRPWV
ncbi:MAG: hypothetical protein U0T74_12815 [Chitinophagales bacterium]